MMTQDAAIGTKCAGIPDKRERGAARASVAPSAVSPPLYISVRHRLSLTAHNALNFHVKCEVPVKRSSRLAAGRDSVAFLYHATPDNKPVPQRSSCHMSRKSIFAVALIIYAVALSISGAFAQTLPALDGNWCHADGKRLTVKGPDIVTPAGKSFARGICAHLRLLGDPRRRTQRRHDHDHDADRRRSGAHARGRGRHAAAGMAALLGGMRRARRPRMCRKTCCPGGINRIGSQALSSIRMSCPFSRHIRIRRSTPLSAG